MTRGIKLGTAPAGAVSWVDAKIGDVFWYTPSHNGRLARLEKTDPDGADREVSHVGLRKVIVTRITTDGGTLLLDYYP